MNKSDLSADYYYALLSTGRNSGFSGNPKSIKGGGAPGPPKGGQGGGANTGGIGADYYY